MQAVFDYTRHRGFSLGLFEPRYLNLAISLAA